MGNDVFANGREISCKAADGKAICAFPDVCMTPPENPATPPGVPVPYPNTGMAKDATKGSKNVKISKKEVMLKNKSYFKKSTGDEAGSAAKKGVVTSVNRGKIFFNSWSMDVKVEGKNVVRHLDLTTHNHNNPGQTPTWPYVDSAAMTPEQEEACNKDREKEKSACAEYKPYTEDGPDVCEKAGLSGKISRSKGVVTERVHSANADQCAAARRCQILPYDAEPRDGIHGCCPAQTPDHIIPKSSFFKTSVKAGELIDGWDKYDANKAPCMCLEGANNTHGNHGLRHAHHKAFSEVKNGEYISFEKESEHCVDGAVAVAPQCEKKCIEAQVAKGHEGMGDKSKNIKHSSSGKKLSKEEADKMIQDSFGQNRR